MLYYDNETDDQATCGRVVEFPSGREIKPSPPRNPAGMFEIIPGVDDPEGWCLVDACVPPHIAAALAETYLKMSRQ